MKDSKQYVWIGVNIPFRKEGGTYATCSYDTLPPCPKLHRFVKFKTIQDLKNAKEDELEMNSITSCYFDFEENSNIFYRDQQDCVVWCLDKNGVYFEDEGKYYVSNSLSEFLWRIYRENQCSYVFRLLPMINKKYEMLGNIKNDFIDGKFNNMQMNENMMYISYYYNIYKKTKEYLINCNYGCTNKYIDKYLRYEFIPNSLTNLEDNIKINISYITYFEKLAANNKLVYRKTLFKGFKLTPNSSKFLVQLYS